MPYQTSWQGYYFDGQSSRRHQVTVLLTPRGLKIQGKTWRNFYWAYDEIRQTQGMHAGEQVRFEKGQEITETLVILDEAFLRALRQIAPRFGRFHEPELRRWKITLLATVGIVVLGLVLWIWGISAIADQLATNIPVSWEERLGEVVVNSLVPVEQRCEDPEKLAILKKIVDRLVDGQPDYPYTFRITVSRGEAANAFAAPGGHIVVYQGLLKETETADQLAGVLAHEIEHVVERHATRAIFREMSLQAIISAMTGDVQGNFALEAAGMLGALHHRRKDEESADREGMKLIQAARIDPQGMIDLFLRFQKSEGQVPKSIKYLSTHPSNVDRIEQLRHLAATVSYTPVPLLPDYPWCEIGRMCHR